jgi:hypothetical protein
MNEKELIALFRSWLGSIVIKIGRGNNGRAIVIGL